MQYQCDIVDIMGSPPEYRHKLKALGKCTNHGKRNAVSGKTKCQECLDYLNNRGPERYQELKAAGLCSASCGKKAREGLTTCLECAAKQHITGKIRNKAEYTKNRQAGLCALGCGVQTSNRQAYCDDCKKILEEHKKKARASGFCGSHTNELLVEGYLSCYLCLWKGAERNIKDEYDISIEDYARMEHVQNRKCAIESCSFRASGLGRQNQLHVDHCHKTDKIRGLLCNRCNVVLGIIEAINHKPYLDYITAYGGV